MNDSALRQNLVELLKGGQAHATAEQALENVTPSMRNAHPKGGHSVWEELEHMRLAQEDILRYTLEAAWISPSFPDGYWPKETAEITDEAWNASVAAFLADLKETIALAQDASVDVTAQIPHGEGRTYLRQILLIADHNAYHLGQLIQTRKALEDWAG